MRALHITLLLLWNHIKYTNSFFPSSSEWSNYTCIHYGGCRKHRICGHVNGLPRKLRREYDY